MFAARMPGPAFLAFAGPCRPPVEITVAPSSRATLAESSEDPSSTTMHSSGEMPTVQVRQGKASACRPRLNTGMMTETVVTYESPSRVPGARHQFCFKD